MDVEMCPCLHASLISLLLKLYSFQWIPLIFRMHLFSKKLSCIAWVRLQPSNPHSCTESEITFEINVFFLQSQDFWSPCSIRLVEGSCRVGHPWCYTHTKVAIAFHHTPQVGDFFNCRIYNFRGMSYEVTLFVNQCALMCVPRLLTMFVDVCATVISNVRWCVYHGYQQCSLMLLTIQEEAQRILQESRCHFL